jgi:hypothetical protein
MPAASPVTAWAPSQSSATVAVAPLAVSHGAAADPQVTSRDDIRVRPTRAASATAFAWWLPPSLPPGSESGSESEQAGPGPDLTAHCLTTLTPGHPQWARRPSLPPQLAAH